MKNLLTDKIKIIKSKRKTLSVEIKPDLSILVRAPFFSSDKDISAFLLSHEKWIVNHIDKMKNIEKPVKKLSEDEIKMLYKKAEAVFKERVAYYAPLIGVSYGKITVRKQKTRWGSCSANKNLSFNCLLMLAPPDVIDSVAVHELCHIKHMNHSKAFYSEVFKVMPNYKECHIWLKENGSRLLRMGDNA